MRAALPRDRGSRNSVISRRTKERSVRQAACSNRKAPTANGLYSTNDVPEQRSILWTVSFLSAILHSKKFYRSWVHVHASAFTNDVLKIPIAPKSLNLQDSSSFASFKAARRSNLHVAPTSCTSLRALVDDEALHFVWDKLLQAHVHGSIHTRAFHTPWRSTHAYYAGFQIFLKHETNWQTNRSEKCHAAKSQLFCRFWSTSKYTKNIPKPFIK